MMVKEEHEKGGVGVSAVANLSASANFFNLHTLPAKRSDNSAALSSTPCFHTRSFSM